ncbi:DUF1574 domain-containing protein [Leptospira wolffii]|uniref:Uncharacterized protein n=1 Tax=Leptospira wolffii TaxID=409998 RepID=A0A2M9ZDN4_9LEPT|nr:DUF1574 domain-containing protein [Leptospira wolffii]PJZ66484.1 hypothetical protein CH371_09520 [Leptospira wolffii]TGK59948.1 DUF1574 domain-containing protein [Leptospira wolffii]TGK67596.1 DUF1574 domain-containing protein [Leptospira wolffii]TGK75956.1 DUF1574 domain-containing protein [Leptospira wolffii]TGL30207.1 DUF1574 domain-containing protein [Leptospira wolffii]
MKKNLFLFIPLLILLFSIAADRILTLNAFEPYYSKSFSHLNFISKEDLYKDLRAELQKPSSERSKILVFFGNSRALLLPYSELRKKYPDWMLYNFSVPGGSPDYFLYWVERFVADGVRPDFVLLDQSLEIYNRTPLLALDEVIVYGVSVDFVLRHLSTYSREEISVFLSKRLFHTFRDRPKLWRVMERLKNDSAEADMYRNGVHKVLDMLEKEKGSTPRELTPLKQAEETIVTMSDSDFSSYLRPYTFYPDMLSVQTESVRLLQKANIPYATIWVRVARPYFELYKSRIVDTSEGPKTPYQVWKPIIDDWNLKTGTELWNMNEDPEYNCDEFADPGHMSPNCFPAFGDYIFRKLKETELTGKNQAK